MSPQPVGRRGRLVVLVIERPTVHVAVVATGLTAVVGSAVWQVLWLIAVVVSLVVVLPGREPDGEDDSGGGTRLLGPRPPSPPGR